MALTSDCAIKVREAIPALVEEVRLLPAAGRLRIEVRGEFGAVSGLFE